MNIPSPLLTASLVWEYGSFIAALLESYTGRRFVVKEVDCWCTGDRTCRFTAAVVAE